MTRNDFIAANAALLTAEFERRGIQPDHTHPVDGGILHAWNTPMGVAYVLMHDEDVELRCEGLLSAKIPLQEVASFLIAKEPWFGK